MHFKRRDPVFIYYFLLSLLILVTTGCDGNNELTSDVIVYQNDFDDGDFTNISGGISAVRYSTGLIGHYNNDGFSLRLNDLPRHEYIYISFTLYIQDTWDGNSNGLTPDKPDKWIMAINSGITSSSTDSYTGFETTFSNGPCDNVLCLTQSYPNNYPHTSSPRSGARREHKGRCANGRPPRATTQYFIERTFRHDDPAIIFNFYDELYQPNVADQKCDESWAMDNLVVRAITIN